MDRQHRRLAARCDELGERLAEAERHVEQLERALRAVARETGGVSVSHPCRRCDKSLLLVRHGQLYCPNCRYGRTV